MLRVAGRAAFSHWLIVSLLFCSLLIGGNASAQPWPAPIRALQDKGVIIVKQFDAPGGMIGFVARSEGGPVPLYLTPDGRHVIIGAMYDGDGNDVSQSQLDAAITGPSRDNAWPRLEKAHWIGDGNDDAPRKVYFFTDPNCPYCHKFYEAARPWVEAGKVQLRHIPVAILGRNSPGKAAALLAADDPKKAVHEHERNYRRGGIEPLTDVPPNIRRQLVDNMTLMSDLALHATPSIVYRDSDGNTTFQQGLPQGAMLDAVMGSK